MTESVNHTECKQCDKLSSTLKTITDNITVSGTGPTGEFDKEIFMPPTDTVYNHWITFTPELSDGARIGCTTVANKKDYLEMEISTRDNGIEPIFCRQYSHVVDENGNRHPNLLHELTLMGSSGESIFNHNIYLKDSSGKLIDLLATLTKLGSDKIVYKS